MIKIFLHLRTRLCYIVKNMAVEDGHGQPCGIHKTILLNHIRSNYIKLYHIILYHVMSCYFISCHAMSYHVMSYAMSCRVTCHVKCHVTCHVKCHVTCHVMSCHIISYLSPSLQLQHGLVITRRRTYGDTVKTQNRILLSVTSLSIHSISSRYQLHLKYH